MASLGFEGKQINKTKHLWTQCLQLGPQIPALRAKWIKHVEKAHMRKTDRNIWASFPTNFYHHPPHPSPLSLYLSLFLSLQKLQKQLMLLCTCVCMHDCQWERMTVGSWAHASVRFAAHVCVWEGWCQLAPCHSICCSCTAVITDRCINQTSLDGFIRVAKRSPEKNLQLS